MVQWQPMKRSSPPKHRFKLVEFTNPRTGSKSWRVSGIKRDGTRIRENFSDPKESQGRQIELEAEYFNRENESALRSTSLSEEQIGIAETCFRLVEEDNQLLTAVRWWQSDGRRKSPTDSPKLDDAFEQFKAALEADGSLRPLTKTATRLRASAFVNSTRNIRVSELTPEVIESFLDGIKTPRTRINYKFGISRFMSWCVERPRRWTDKNPCAAIKIRIGDVEPPQILTVEQCEKLVRAAEKFKGGRLVPYLALTMFGGLRPFEARRMKWEQINFDDGELRIEAVQSKIKRSRTFKMDDTTAAWLRAYKGRDFFPDNFVNDWPVMLRLAGFGKAKSGLRPWTKDVLRHTCISHFFRKVGSYGLAAERFGNSEGVIKRHYQGRVNSEDTKKFYALMPKGKAGR